MAREALNPVTGQPLRTSAGGLNEIVTDSTLKGTGTSSNPLKVATPAENLFNIAEATVEQTSYTEPDNDVRHCCISLADFFNDSALDQNIDSNYDLMANTGSQQIIFPAYGAAGGSQVFKFNLSRIVKRVNLPLLNRLILSTNVSEMLEENKFMFERIVKGNRINKALPIPEETSYLIFRDYTQGKRLYDRFYQVKLTDMTQHELIRGTWNELEGHYSNYPIAGWYLIGKTYASMNGVLGGVIAYNNVGSVNPGAFSFDYRESGLTTNVLDSIFAVPYSYVESIWIGTEGSPEAPEHFLYISFRHILHMPNVSQNLPIKNFIHLYLPKF
jgi:hypothetical protein